MPDALPAAQPTASMHCRPHKALKAKALEANAIKIRKFDKQLKIKMNAAINWRSTLVSEKLHCADFVNNPSIITAVMQNYSHDQKSWYAPRITVFTVIVLL